jgi:hypothetical protein
MTVKREISLMAATLTLLLSLFLSAATAKADGDTAVLHVTSVRQDEAKDWCDTGKCVATRFTVEGYRAAKNPNQVIRYVLECVEVVNTETGKLTISCPRVQADGEYFVKILADAIMFPTAPQPKDGVVSGYAIKLQKIENR